LGSIYTTGYFIPNLEVDLKLGNKLQKWTGNWGGWGLGEQDAEEDPEHWAAR